MNNLVILIFTLDTLRLDINLAYKISLANNFGYKEEVEREKLSNILFYKSLFSYMPNLSISGSYSDVKREDFISSRENYSLTLDFSQNIFSPLSLRNIVQNFYSKNIQRFLRIDEKKKLFLNVLDKYLELLKAEKILNLREKSLKRAYENSKIFEEKYKLNAISKLDYLNSIINLRAKEIDYKEAVKNIQDRKWGLLLILGIREEKIILLEEPEFKEEKIDYEFEELLKITQDKKEIILSLKESKKSAFSDFLFSSLSFLPEFKWGYYFTYQDTIFPKSYNYLRENFEKCKGFYFSFNFKFFDYPFDVVKERKNYEIQKIYLEKNLFELYEEIENAVTSLNLAKENILLSNSYLEAAKEGYNLADAEYKVGKISYVEFLKAEESLLDAELKYISSKYDYIKYKYTLLFLTGLLEEVR
ncbi:MAG: TolC family protein [candidate division WOR-3 bacterium]